MHYLHNLHDRLHDKYESFRSLLHHKDSSSADFPGSDSSDISSNASALLSPRHLPRQLPRPYVPRDSDHEGGRTKTVQYIKDDIALEQGFQANLVKSASFDPPKNQIVKKVVNYITDEIHSSIFEHHIEQICISWLDLSKNELDRLKRQLKEDFQRYLDIEVRLAFFKGHQKHRIECSDEERPAQWLKEKCDLRFKQFKWDRKLDISDIDKNMSFSIEMSPQQGVMTVTKIVGEEMTSREFMAGAHNKILRNHS